MRVGRVVHRSAAPDERQVICVDEAMLPAIAGLDAYSHWIVVFQTVVSARLERRDASGGSFGVCATRSRERPSGLGVSVVEYLRRDDELLYVRGLAAVVGDAVLDIQPYVATMDAVPLAVSVPAAFDTKD